MSAQGDCHSGPSRPTTTLPRTASILLVGNPNVGKSTLFNALTRARQRVVNAPGTTVDLTQGVWSTDREDLTLVDLPAPIASSPAPPTSRWRPTRCATRLTTSPWWFSTRRRSAARSTCLARSRGRADPSSSR